MIHLDLEHHQLNSLSFELQLSFTRVNYFFARVECA